MSALKSSVVLTGLLLSIFSQVGAAPKTPALETRISGRWGSQEMSAGPRSETPYDLPVELVIRDGAGHRVMVCSAKLSSRGSQEKMPLSLDIELQEAKEPPTKAHFETGLQPGVPATFKIRVDETHELNLEVTAEEP